MTNKRAPRNTAKIDHADALGMVLETMAGYGGDMIERQEQAGQASFVNSTTLPTQCSPESRAALEVAGVVFGEVVDGDPLFTYVTLPDGWRKQATDHSMGSNLVDEKGRKRAGIFYKAAFYDRKANMHATRRYSAGIDYDHQRATGGYDDGEYIGQACDHDGTVLFATAPNPWEGEPKSWERTDITVGLAAAWLDEHYPNWHDASAYWGEAE